VSLLRFVQKLQIFKSLGGVQTNHLLKIQNMNVLVKLKRRRRQCEGTILENSLMESTKSKEQYDKVQRTTSRLDDFTTYDFATFTTSRLVIDLETEFIVQK
jgi:hypothetical protein